MFNTLLSKENIYSWTYYVSHNVFFSSKEMTTEFGIPEYISGTDLESLLLPCIYPADQFVARRLLSIVESGGSIDNSSIRLLNRHKELSWFSLSSCFDPKTNIYYGIIKNIHALKCSEEKLVLESVRNNKTKAQLNKLQKLSKVGMWKLNKDQMKFSLEDETAQILGVPNHKLLSVDALEAIVHHEDRVAFRASILAILHQQSEQAFEFRISTHLRPLLFIRMQAANKLGAVHSAIIEGTLQDISDLKIYSLELEAKNLQLQSINQNMVNHAAEIEVARRKAEESDTLKTSFLSNISHEVRTPISSIGGFAELLRSDTITKDQRERYIGLILQSNKQLLQIFTDVIELSKINSNQLSVNIEPFSVNNMLRELRDEYLPLLHAKRLQIQLETPLADNKCTILSDSNKIHRVLSAIIDNAVKFTESGTIRLSYTFHAGKLSVQVQDTGIGIPDDKLKYIFQPFRQGDETLGRGYGGIGLGLSIVDGLVKLLSGNICVKSKIGIGTTIRFTMPATLVEPESVCLADVVTSCDWSDKTFLPTPTSAIIFSVFSMNYCHNRESMLFIPKQLRNLKKSCLQDLIYRRLSLILVFPMEMEPICLATCMRRAYIGRH